MNFAIFLGLMLVFGAVGALALYFSLLGLRAIWFELKPSWRPLLGCFVAVISLVVILGAMGCGGAPETGERTVIVYVDSTTTGGTAGATTSGTSGTSSTSSSSSSSGSSGGSGGSFPDSGIEIDDQCNETQQCETGLLCAGGHCLPPAAFGQACDPWAYNDQGTLGDCQTGLACFPSDSQVDGGTCLACLTKGAMLSNPEWAWECCGAYEKTSTGVMGCT